eukprot:4868405-Pyramimonas_sp.AAC.1
MPVKYPLRFTLHAASRPTTAQALFETNETREPSKLPKMAPIRPDMLQYGPQECLNMPNSFSFI